MMTEALFPSDVSASTSGAILLAGVSDTDPVRWPPAREEPIAPTAAIAAAIKNTEQKIRRQRDGVNVEVGCEFVIMRLAGGFEFGCLRTETENPVFNVKRGALSNLFPQVFMVLDAVRPKPNAVPSKVERIILFRSVEAAAQPSQLLRRSRLPAATMLTSQATRPFDFAQGRLCHYRSSGWK